jgi:LysR family transcriptional regulator (chromosome initiation inhibitor)
LRLTAAGQQLLGYARQMAALQGQWRADWAKDWGQGSPGAAGDAGRQPTPTPAPSVPVAVNADSLATWVLSALSPVVQAGQVRPELLVDDQAFTHDWLREGRVLGCVAAEPKALRGCTVQPLGAMRYGAYASPAFVAQALGGDAKGNTVKGLTRHSFAHTPFLIFNRKDAMQRDWVSKAFGLRRPPQLVELHVPSSEAYLQAVALGWGVGVLPHLQAAPAVARGELVAVLPQVVMDVALYWHRWALGNAALDAVGSALLAGAKGALGSLKSSAKPRAAAPAARPK